MAKMYPHQNMALLSAKVPPNDLDDQMQLLYFNLHGGPAKPNYIYKSNTYRKEVNRLLDDYQQLLKAQQDRVDGHKTDWANHSIWERKTPNALQNLLNRVDKLRDNMLNIAAYDMQHRPHAEYFKTLLEKNLLLLTSLCNDNPKIGQKILAELCYEFNACTAGVIGHAATIYSRLNNHDHITYWLADYRTSLVAAFTSQAKFPPGEINRDIAIFNDFIRVGGNPLRKTVRDEAAGGSTASTAMIHEFYEFLEKEYTAKGIVDCVTSNTAGLIKKFNKSFKTDKHGWINIDPTADDAEEYPDVQKRATLIVDALNVVSSKKLDVSELLELDEDGTKIRINPELMGDNLRKFISDYLLQTGIITKNSKESLKASTLIAKSKGKPAAYPGMPVGAHPPAAPLPDFVAPGPVFAHANNHVTRTIHTSMLWLSVACDTIGSSVLSFSPQLITNQLLRSMFAYLLIPFTLLSLGSIFGHALARKYAQDHYQSQPVIAGKTQVSLEEKQAFDLGVKSEASYKQYVLNLFRPTAWKHPIAAMAGAQAASQNRADLINHMKP